MDNPKLAAQILAKKYADKGDPDGWFEDLYAQAGAEHVKTAGSCNRKRPPKTTENGHLVHSDRGHFSEIIALAGRFRLYCS